MNHIEQPYNKSLPEESIDFRRYISLFISNWYWFAAALFISFTIAYGINRYSEKIYTVSSTLLIKDEQMDGGTGFANIFPGTNAFYSKQNLNNEIGILKSHDLNLRVMNSLPSFHVVYVAIGKRGIVESRLYQDSPFEVVYDSLGKQTKDLKIHIEIENSGKYKLRLNGNNQEPDTIKFGERYKTSLFDFKIILKDSASFTANPNIDGKFYFYFPNLSQLANQYRGKLSISPIEEESSLVVLSVSGPVAEQESDYLNKLMNIYRQYGLDQKNETAANTINFVTGQLDTIRKVLEDAEEKLQNFRNKNNLIDISKEGELIQARVQDVEEERNLLMLQKRYYEYLKEYIYQKRSNQEIISPSVMGINDQLLITLVQNLADLEKQKKSLAMNLEGSANPLKVIDNNINTVKRSLAENIETGLSNIDGNLRETEIRIAAIDEQVKKLPEKERQLINFERTFQVNNDVYRFLLEKKAEAQIALASNVSDNREIDLAGPHSTFRIKPKEKRNYSMALIWGLMIPVIGIFLVDYLNNKIIDKRDIERGTNAPIIGYISHNNIKSEVPVIEKPGSAISESFRSVRTNLKYFTNDIQCPVIAISSTVSSEGKTFISANIAAIIASLDKKVLLIGLDLRKPRIHKIFDIKNDVGMSSYLIGQDKFEKIICKTGINNLWYASAGPVPPNPAELIESSRMKEFISRAKGEFDFIVIDTPPVSIVTDALLVSPLTDFYLFVVRQRYSSKSTLGLIEELYISQKIKNIAIVINDISLSGYYGYGLRYGYSLGYGYSYGYNYYGYSGYSRYGYSNMDKSYYKED